MRRARGNKVLQAGGLSLDVEKHLVTRGNGQIRLMPQECKLLSIFMQHPGEVLSRAFLMQRAWGWEISEPRQARTLEVHVRWLREKLEDDPHHPRLIRTVRGVGYRFEVLSPPR